MHRFSVFICAKLMSLRRGNHSYSTVLVGASNCKTAFGERGFINFRLTHEPGEFVNYPDLDSDSQSCVGS